MSCQCGFYPTVIVPGIGQCKVDLLDNEGVRVKSAWPLDIDNKALLKKLIPCALKMLIMRRDAGFTDLLYRELCAALSPIGSTAEGFPKSRLKVVDYPRSLAECTEDEKRFIYKMVPMEALSEAIGESHLFYFAYYSFGQPYETAKDLHNFIQMVKDKTGHDKVNLVPVSLGGSISVAYFDVYGDREDIYRVMNFVPAINGSTIVADVFEDRVNSGMPGEILDFIVDKKTAQKIASYMRVLPEGMPERITETALSAARDTIFLNCPGIWATCPRERYEALRDRFLCDGKHEVLRAKADRFHRVHKDYEKLLKEQVERGVEFFTVCGYGKRLAPFVLSDKLNSDSIVDLKSASLGAYSAPPGEVLPEDYVPVVCAAGHSHVSPDRVVDAGTGLFPDTTWYFSDQIHDDIAYNDIALLLCREVLTNDGFKDVFSDPAFPQFNGSRNIREIRYRLLPKVPELLETALPEHVRDELQKAAAECEELFSYTIVKDNTLTEKATARLRAAIQAATPAQPPKKQ